MSNSPQIRVSIDVGYRQHSVAVGLSNGELLDEFEIAHDPHGFDAFFTRIESHQGLYDGEIAVAMEGYNGFARPLDSLVQKRRWQLYNINNLKLARFKEIFPAAAKSDRIDARRALELFQLQDHLPLAKRVLQRVPPGSLCNAKLKRLTRRRRTLVDDKVQVLNRFQSDLQAVCPCLLGITRHADNLWFLRLITQVSTLPKLARLREKTLLKIPSIGRNYVAIIRQWQKRARFSGEAEYAEDERPGAEHHGVTGRLAQFQVVYPRQCGINTDAKCDPLFGRAGQFVCHPCQRCHCGGGQQISQAGAQASRMQQIKEREGR